MIDRYILGHKQEVNLNFRENNGIVAAILSFFEIKYSQLKSLARYDYFTSIESKKNQLTYGTKHKFNDKFLNLLNNNNKLLTQFSLELFFNYVSRLLGFKKEAIKIKITDSVHFKRRTRASFVIIECRIDDRTCFFVACGSGKVIYSCNPLVNFEKHLAVKYYLFYLQEWDSIDIESVKGEF